MDSFTVACSGCSRGGAGRREQSQGEGGFSERWIRQVVGQGWSGQENWKARWVIGLGGPGDPGSEYLGPRVGPGGRSGTRDFSGPRPTEDEPCASNPASQAHDPTRPPGTYRETCETGETYGLEWVLTPDGE